MPRRWCLGLLLLSGCSPQSKQDAPPQPQAARLTFPKDDLGRVVALKLPAKRVVVIGPGACESLFAIGAGKAVVGRDAASDFPKEAKVVPVAGDFSGPNVEKCVSLRPDLIVVQGETYGAARADDWQQKTGVPVAVLSATTVEGLLRGMLKLGAWAGRLKDADRVVMGDFNKQMGRLKLPDNARIPRAFIEVGREPIYTAGRGTLIHDVLKPALLRNAAEKVNGYAAFNVEALLASQPDYYVATYAGGQENPVLAGREKAALKRHPVLGKLRCVREGRIIALPADWLLRPGPRLGLGVAELRKPALDFILRHHISQQQTRKP